MNRGLLVERADVGGRPQSIDVRPQAAQPFLLRLLNNSIKMIFASFFDGFPVVERARVQYVRLGSLCINMYYVGLPVCVLAGRARSNVYIRYETDGVSWPDVRRTQLVQIFRETFGFYFPKPPYATGPWGVPRVK